MAKPMTATQFRDALKAEGVKVRERTGWKTHNRNHKGSWGPLHGVMIHHTASGTEGIESYVSTGSAELPGPLCQGLIEKDGTVVLVGWGRANHAGGGDPDVLEAVVNETYPLPETSNHDGSPGSVDGNAHFVGFECVNRGDGKDPWPAVQLEAMARASAAVCRYYGWSENSVIRHADWSDWKNDPRGVDWTAFRLRVRQILDGDSDPKPDPKPPVKLPKVSVARVVAAARKDPSAAQGAASHATDVKPVEAALAKLGFMAGTYASDGSFGSVTVRAYAQFQRSLGYRGQDADGVPGKQSLSVLAARSGLFTVTN